MKKHILVVDDEIGALTLIGIMLERGGFGVLKAKDAKSALSVLDQNTPDMIILDVMMPGMDGTEVCRKVRELPGREPPYIILLTTRHLKEDVVAGLDSGADDYVIKPFDRQELRSRLRVAERIVGLQGTLAERVRELETALAQVRQLKGLLPICSYCKKIRDDDNYWHQVDAYISIHSDINFSHSICPTCWKEKVEPDIARGNLTGP